VVEPTRGAAVLDLVLTRDSDQISSVDVTETVVITVCFLSLFITIMKALKMSGQLKIT